MDEKIRFNLIDEPWIRVLDDAGTAKEVSLLELFHQAPKLKCLANDLPTQDFAILRVVLAILQRSISPMLDDLDEDMEPAEVWRQLWEASELPMDVIEVYLAKWHDRFDLFDPKRPFMQVPGLRTPKNELLSVSKIVADVPDGSKLFSLRSGHKLDELSFAEAARWLIHVQAFDTAGIKSGVVGDQNIKGGKSYPRGTSWAGNLGGMFVEGDTLRETLLLNFILSGNDKSEFFFDADIPTWEQPLRPFGSLDKVPSGRTDIFTWQSRRVRLVAQHEMVTGLVLTNGDRLEAKNMQKLEPMTAWKRNAKQEKKLKQAPIYLPVGHKSSKALWRGLSSIFSINNEEQDWSEVFEPGVLSWIEFLTSANGGRKLSKRKLLRVHGVGFEYGTQNSIITDVIDDAILFSSFLLSSDGQTLMTLACNCVDETDQAIKALGKLSANLSIAAGGDQSDTEGLITKIKTEAYFELDALFRHWLAGLDVASNQSTAREQWHRQARTALASIARRCVTEAGSGAIKGALKKGQHNKNGTWITAAKAEAWFSGELKKALPLESDITREEVSTSGKQGK